MRVPNGLRFLLVATTSVLTLSACNGGSTGGSSPPSASLGQATPPLELRAHIAHVNEQTGTATFAFLAAGNEQFKLPAGATPVDVAWGTLRAVAKPFKLDNSAIAAARVAAVHDVGRGAIITRFNQSVGGVDIFRAELNVTMKRDLTPVAVSGGLAPSSKPLATKGWVVEARQAVANGFRTMTGLGVDPAGFTAVGTDAAGLDRYGFAVANGETTLYGHARVKRVWYQKTNGLLPAYYVEVDVANSKNSDARLNSFVMHAGDGSQLYRHDMVAADNYSYRVWADGTGPKGMAPLDSPYGNGLTPNATGMFDANAMPPSYLAPSLVNLQNIPFSKNDPWLPTAATELSGNNVHAYADLVAPDGYNAGTDVSVTPTAPGVFDRTWDPTTLPGGSTARIQAITTNLFFIVNYMHDLFYDSGYDEASRNSQNDNYGRGGTGNDAINAESQDYSGLDNANMSTPSDGCSGAHADVPVGSGHRQAHRGQHAGARYVDQRRLVRIRPAAVEPHQHRRQVPRHHRQCQPRLHRRRRRFECRGARGQDRAHRPRHLHLHREGAQRQGRRSRRRAHRQQRDRDDARQLRLDRPRLDHLPRHAAHLHRRQ